MSSDEGASFGGSVSVSTSVSTTVGNSDESGSSESSSSGTGEESSDGADADSTSGAADSSGSASASTGVLEESSGGGEGGVQPQDGMYSHCLAPAECVGVNLCITVMPMGEMMPSTGFCTQTGCANAAADCLPNPGGTATPTCFPVTVNMMAQQACALDCSGGKTCPAPMTCWSLTDGMICA